MIKSFKDKEAQKVYNLQVSKKLPRDIQQRAYNKLALLNVVSCVEMLKIPPSNYLEKLKGNRKNEWSIRINQQWRICFRFNEQENNAYDVSIEDYH